MNSINTVEIDEQLTAYLDGELSNSERVVLEQRLVEDQNLRIRLAELRKTFDLLDDLPETPHNQQFTKSTLELVVRDLSTSIAETGDRSEVGKKADWLTWPSVAGPLLGLLATGILIGSSLGWFSNRRELRELSLIANFSGLSDANELAVVTSLSKDRDVLELLKEHLLERTFLAIPSSLSERQTWVNSLTSTQLAILESNREKLRKLDRNTHARFAAIQTQIENRDDRETLQETLQLIGIVMDSLPNSKRQDLEVLSADQRTEFLRSQIFLKASIHYSAQLPPTDAQAIEDWSMQTLIPALNSELGSFGRQLSIDIKALLNSLWFWRRIEDGFELNNQQKLVDDLIPRLSPLGGKLLAGVNRSEQLQVLSAWIVPNQISSTQRLIDSYDKINRDPRDEIDLLSPGQSKLRLEENARRQLVPTRPRPR